MTRVAADSRLPLFLGIPPVVINPDPSQPVRSIIYPNGTTLTAIPLPTVSPELHNIIRNWEVQWRPAVSNAEWNVTILSRNAFSARIPNLPRGNYQVRVRALYTGGQTPFSAPVVFESLGSQGKLLTFAGINAAMPPPPPPHTRLAFHHREVVYPNTPTCVMLLICISSICK